MLHKDEFGNYALSRNNHANGNPLISVVMAAYNSEGTLFDAIQSILNQTYKNLEFIIINDCSNDNTLKIIQDAFSLDNRICVINNEENIGLTKSLIRGIGLSRGQYIARQDADDVSVLSRLEKQMGYFPEYDFVCSRTMINEKKVLPKLLSVYLYPLLIKQRNVFVHGSFLFKKELYDKVGGYNSDFVFAQDYELICNFMKNQARIKYLSEVLYYSRKSSESISNAKLIDQNHFAHMVKEKYKI